MEPPLPRGPDTPALPAEINLGGGSVAEINLGGGSVAAARRLAPDAQSKLLAILGEDWHVVDQRLSRTMHFPDFKSALAFVNRAGEVAEREQHHPDLHLAWGKVTVELWTHSASGLTENDFILAAKLDHALEG